MFLILKISMEGISVFEICFIMIVLNVTSQKVYSDITPNKFYQYTIDPRDYFIENQTSRAKNHRYFDDPYDYGLLDHIYPLNLHNFNVISERNDTFKDSLNDNLNEGEILVNPTINHRSGYESALDYPNEPNLLPPYGDQPRISDKIDYDYDYDYVKPLQVAQKKRIVVKRCGKCKCGVQVRNHHRNEHGTPNEFPWLAMLAYFGRIYCSGSLINSLYVVSAGHCTRGYQTARIIVRFVEFDGGSAEDTSDIIRKVSRVLRPKGYNEKSLDNDISLLKLARTVPVRSSLIRPVCLPEPKTSFGGQDGILVGWGTSSDTEPASMVRRAIVPILSNRRCRATDHGDSITSKMICAKNPSKKGRSGCFTESGGPLLAVQGGRYRLAGIVSWGKSCAKRAPPGVYTRVTKFSRWIRKYSSGACWCS